MVDTDVRAKCNVLFRQWAVSYKGKPGLERIAALYKQLPQTRRPQPHQSKVIKETEADAESTPSSPITETRPSRSSSSAATSSTKVSFTPAAPVSTSSSFFSHREKKHKKSKSQPFNLEREKPKIMETIAAASVASTNLLNALQLINREQQRVSENPGVVKLFENCKHLRRQILRYIQLVESDQWIGSLLSANDELVKALMSYEIMDKSISDDSDSETEARAVRSPASPTSPTGPPSEQLASLNLGENPPPKPPRPSAPPIPTGAASGKQRVEESESESEPEEDEDDDNPFADKNAVTAEAVEGKW